MAKQEIIGISNREDYVELILKKEETYYPFLFSLLKKLNMRIPDLQDFMGNDPKIMEEKDASLVYGERPNQIYEVIGCNHIFFIYTH